MMLTFFRLGFLDLFAQGVSPMEWGKSSTAFHSAQTAFIRYF